MDGERETYEMNTGPRCPYCDHLHHADEPAYYDENNSPFECEHCLNEFEMEVYQSTSWTCTAISPLPHSKEGGKP